MTNGSKVLIYLTLLYFKFYCTHVSNAKGNIAKSNKSELWNHLSYRGLPYLFEVRSQTFRNDYKILRSQPQNSTLIVLWPQWPQKRHEKNLKIASYQCKSSKYSQWTRMGFLCWLIVGGEILLTHMIFAYHWTS